MLLETQIAGPAKHFLLTAMNALKAHARTPQPWATLMFALAWSYLHHNLWEQAIRLILPRRVSARLKEKWKCDARLRMISAINIVGFSHALTIVPLALVALADKRLWNDIPNGTSSMYELVIWITGGYFVWDTQTCLRRVRAFGPAFLIHGILSLVGVYSQGAISKARYATPTLMFLLTETSTPFLHLRWFTMKARDFSTPYFKIINVLFLASFVFFRLFFVEVFCISPYFIRLYNSPHEVEAIGHTKLAVETFFILAWLALNVYWGALLLGSQLKRWFVQRNPTYKFAAHKRALLTADERLETNAAARTAPGTPNDNSPPPLPPLDDAHRAAPVSLTEAYLGD